MWLAINNNINHDFGEKWPKYCNLPLLSSFFVTREVLIWKLSDLSFGFENLSFSVIPLFRYGSFKKSKY